MTTQYMSWILKLLLKSSNLTLKKKFLNCYLRFDVMLFNKNQSTAHFSLPTWDDGCLKSTFS